MNPGFGRGRGRRQVLQLSNSSSSSGYLARHGYQHLSDDTPSNGRQEKSNQEAAGLSRLVGAYDDSESEEDEKVPEEEPKTHIQAPNIIPPKVSSGNDGVKVGMDSEVACFLAEINAISTDDPEVVETPVIPGAFIPRDKTAELLAEKQKIDAEPAVDIPVYSEPRPAKKHKSYSMFVKGGSEQLGDKSTTTQMKPKVSVYREEEINSFKLDEKYELPEAPTTVWQQCQDEKTHYVYYWNYASNKVTWEMPGDYTQYLLLVKEYEEKLSRIPEDIRSRLEAKKKLETSQKANERKEKMEAPSVTPIVASPSIEEKQPEPSIDSSILNIKNIKAKCKLKKAMKKLGVTEKSIVGDEAKSAAQKDPSCLSVSDVDMFVSDILSTATTKEKSDVDDDDKDGIDFDVDDIDAALESALEQKLGPVSKSVEEFIPEVTEYYHMSGSKSSEPSESTDANNRLDNKQKRSPSEEGELDEEVEPKKARLVAAYDDDSDDDDKPSSSCETKDSPEAAVHTRPVPSLIQMKDEVEDVTNIALGKLEFLEVTKKGLSKLQVLLLQLQTRFRDWQDGGLDTEYFLSRLQEANRQLEQYEESAVPADFTCQWDRNFRRYFYTNKVTGESQWEYPDVVPVTTTESDTSEVTTSSNEPALPTEQPPSPSPPPPPPEESCSSPSEDVSPEKKTASEPSCDEAMVNLDLNVPDSSWSISEITDQPDDASISAKSKPSPPPIFPGEPPPPGTEVVFGLPPPPPPSEPYPGANDPNYSVDHDSADDNDAGMDVDDGATSSPVNEDAVTSSALECQHLPATSTTSVTDNAPGLVSENTPVIYAQPQLNVVSTISAHCTPTASLISSLPVTFVHSASSVSEISEEISSTSAVVEAPPLPPLPTTMTTETVKQEKKEKRKKKDKSMASSSLSLKKKNVSSLVEKWQKVKVEVEKEERVNEERQMAIRQQLEEWKQMHS